MYYAAPPHHRITPETFFISSILYDHMKMTLLRGGVDFFCREQIRLDDRFQTLATAGPLKGHYYTDKGPF